MTPKKKDGTRKAAPRRRNAPPPKAPPARKERPPRGHTALRESEERYRIVFESSNDAIMLLDDRGFLDCNVATLKLFGLDGKDEFRKNHPADLSPPVQPGGRDSRTAADDMIRTARRNGSHRFEWVHRKRDGTDFFADVLLTACPLEGRRIVLATVRNITEQKNAERAIRESERKVRAVFDQTFQFIGVMTVDGILTDVNRSAMKFSGITEADVIGKPFWETPWWTHSPELQAKLRDAVRRAAEGEFLRFEATHVAADGTLHDIDFSLKPIADETGRVAFLIPEGRDVTEDKRIGRQLRESEQRLRELHESLRDGLAVVDLKGTITQFNPEFRKMLGYEPDEIHGLTYEDITPKKWHALEGRIITEQVMKRGYSDLFEKEYIRKDGTVFPIELRIYLARDDAGAPRNMWAFVRDITERKRAREALQEAEKKYRLIFDGAGDAIFIHSAEGRMLAVNRVACERLGYTREEMMATSPAIVDVPEEAVHIPARVAALQEKGRVVFETVHRRKDGGRIPTEVNAQIVQFDGEPAVLAICRDITDRKRAETELRLAMDVAERAARAKSEFVANMSHEIRTPMNGVMAMLDLALDTTLTEEQRGFLDLARSSADSLLTIINDILDFSKIEARKLELEQIEFRLAEILEEVLPFAGVDAHQKGLELVLDVESGLPPVLLGDPLRLKQILVNLLRNAVKFTPQGHVLLRVERGEPSGPGTLQLRFAVTDTGIGIPEEYRKRIFDSFTQSDASTTRRYGGTGLGLAISRHLVELMDGTITVESRVGVGSTFRFTVTLRVPERQDAVSALGLPEMEGLAALVVDDNALNREVLRRHLESWGLVVTEASGGRECLTAVRAAPAGHPYTLILLDRLMPDLDGFEVAGELRRDGPGPTAIIIMLTSLHEKGDRERCASIGISQFLVKPITPSSLYDALVTALGQTPTVRPQQPGALGTPADLTGVPRNLRILLAEDNAVNVTVVERLLDRVGLRATVARDGRKALEALEHGTFDLVLMDVQMPEIDGTEVTRRFREREGETGRRTPIVALTAHSMRGDRERFLAAGMDDYLAKPLRGADLYRVISRVASGLANQPAPAAAPAADGASGTADTVPLYDAADLEGRMEGDDNVVRAVLRVFLQESDGAIEGMAKALRERDAAALRMAAHAAKGMAANAAALRLRDACLELEREAVAGRPERAADLVARAGGIQRQTCEEIRRHIGG